MRWLTALLYNCTYMVVSARFHFLFPLDLGESQWLSPVNITDRMISLLPSLEWISCCHLLTKDFWGKTLLIPIILQWFCSFLPSLNAVTEKIELKLGGNGSVLSLLVICNLSLFKPVLQQANYLANFFLSTPISEDQKYSTDHIMPLGSFLLRSRTVWLNFILQKVLVLTFQEM